MGVGEEKGKGLGGAAPSSPPPGEGGGGLPGRGWGEVFSWPGLRSLQTRRSSEYLRCHWRRFFPKELINTGEVGREVGTAPGTPRAAQRVEAGRGRGGGGRAGGLGEGGAGLWLRY